MALSSRSLKPELLDELPASDPRAERSRRDLRRINAIMGNARIIARHLGQASRIADLGGGDGSLMRAVERKLGRRLEITNVDRIHGLDVFEFLQHPGKALDAIVANLFLHHLDAASLRRLLELASQRAPLFVACEPRRSAPALWASRLVGLIGANNVTRHDSVVSVRAGFRGRELSEAWPVVAGGWVLAERLAPPFSHLFVARRDGIV
jgi:hypothetical protein